MNSLDKYHYTFEILSWNDWNEDYNRYSNGYTIENLRKKYQRKEFYGDYKVNFVDKTAFITVNSNDKQFLNEVIYYKDQKVFSRHEGRGWDILRLKKEDYSAQFKNKGVLSLFDFDSFNTSRMVTLNEEKNVVLKNIYLPKFDFIKRAYCSDAFEVEMQVDKLTNLVQTVMFEGTNQCNYTGHIRYKFNLFAVNEMVKIEEPF